jgi:GNAT superfamily N-acetyltransferase
MISAQTIIVRNSKPEDMPSVLELIKELAHYEKAPNEVINTSDNLIADGFGEGKIFDCLVAENQNNVIVGFALFFIGYSTWKGKTLYLEDILVTESYRKQGIGEKLFLAVKAEAEKRGVKRMDWQVLDWNEPAIRFYKKHRAHLDPEWINGRFFFN